MTGGRSDASVTTLLLAGRLLDGETRPFSPKEYWDLVGRVGDPGRLLGQDAGAITSSAGLADPDGERIAALLEGAPRLAFELEGLEHRGILVLTPFDEAYPQALTRRLGSG